MKRIQLPGFAMAYDEGGAGIPLLFLHGYPLGRALWQQQLDGLADAAHLLAVDLRGHGDSSAVPGPYPMDLLAEDCYAFLDAVGITRPVVLCGLSMGGYVAFAFYRRYASRVAGLILTATRASADTVEGRLNRDKAAALAQKRRGKAAIVEAMLPKMISPQTSAQHPERVEDLQKIMTKVSVQGMVGDLLGMRDRPDSTPTLAQIACPTLLVFGADDQFVPRAEIDAMHVGIRGSELCIVPDAGHLPNFEQPEAFNTAAREFLKKVDA